MTDSEKLQAIYDSETHGEISWFWDGGIIACYGQYSNPWFETERLNTVKEAIDWLYSKHLERKT